MLKHRPLLFPGYSCHLFALAVSCKTKKQQQNKHSDCTAWNDTVVSYSLLLKDCVLHLQEEMTRLQENLEKLKVQGSEDDSEEKVTLNKRLELIILHRNNV